MTTVPAETGSQTDASALALVLVQILAIGLPEPPYITISPWAAHRRYVSAISFQFDSADEVEAVQKWADWFGVAVTRQDGDAGRCWVRAEFTYLDVRFQVYAETGGQS